MSQRALIEPHEGDKRYQRRDARGQFSDSDDAGQALAADRRQPAWTAKPRNEGDRGD